MNESSDEPPLLDRIRSWARTKAYVSTLPPLGVPNDHNSDSTLNDPSIHGQQEATQSASAPTSADQSHNGEGRQQNSQSTLGGDSSSTLPPPAPPPVGEKREGEESSSIESKEKKPLGKRFINDCKRIIFCSWINWLLLFVPVGIIIGAIERSQGHDSVISPTVVFSMNAIAIIPLASLLAFATESVATKMGDTIGALLNVTFGNAVELIVFIIALVANEIQIVQAAALGSILSNLLLILGMCFLFGGLRFREQVG
jgi:Ca2+:H+ antiporter